MANGVTFYTENSGVPHVWVRVEYNGQGNKVKLNIVFYSNKQRLSA